MHNESKQLSSNCVAYESVPKLYPAKCPDVILVSKIDST
mgnify:CR=1 FL=1